MAEQWKAVAGFEGFYEVSNLGRVRSLSRVVKCSTGTGTRVWKGRLLALTPATKLGYVNLHLHAGGKRRSTSAHVLVAEAFIPNPLGLPEVNHKNSKRADNKKSNLEWVTEAGNAVHGFKHGHRTVKKGSKQWMSVLITAQVKEIRQRFSAGETQQQLAKVFGVNQSVISTLVNGKTWKHVPLPQPQPLQPQV